MSINIAVAFTGGIDSTVLTYWLMDQWPKLHRNEGIDSLHLMIADYGQASYKKSEELGALHSHRLYAREFSPLSITLHRVPLAIHVKSEMAGLLEEGYVPPYDNPSRDDYSKPSRPYEYAHIEGRNANIFLRLLTACVEHEVDILYTGYQYDPLEWANLDAYRHRVCDAGPNLTDRMNLLQEVGFTKRVRIENPFITLRMSKADIITLGRSYGIDIEKETYSCQFYPKCEKCENCQNVRDVLLELAGGSRD